MTLTQIAWIATVPLPVAAGPLRTLYADIRRTWCVVPRALQVFSLRPELLEACLRTFLATMAGGTVSRQTKGLLAVVVSRANACAYGMDAHAMMLMAAGLSAARIDGMVRNPGDPVLAASVAFARTATEHLEDVTPASLAALRAAGADEGEVVEIVQVIAGVNFINRIVNSLGVRPELPAALRRWPAVRRMGLAVGAALLRIWTAQPARPVPAPESHQPHEPRDPAVVFKEIEAVCQDRLGLTAIPLYCACRALAHRPAMLEADWAMSRAVYTQNRLPLDMVMRLIRLTASLNRVPDVEADAAAWLARHGHGPEPPKQDDEASRRLLAFARLVVRSSGQVTASDLVALRAVGWRDDEILEAAYVASASTAQNLMAKALTGDPPSDRRPDSGASRPSPRP